MNKQLLNAILKQDFKSFVIKVFNEVSAGAEYLDNWHVDFICNELMNMRDGENNRLIINIPPRYMKSIICSVALPAYLLGHYPKTNIICVSYSDDLSTKFANDCRNVMISDWCRELFPMTRLHKSRTAISGFQTTNGGGRMATSIGGTLTGRGADWIIIDDPLKPADAMSDTQREKVNDWYGSTLYSRLNNKNTGKIILIMQRLHQMDLTGYLLESNAKFKHIRLPVIAEEDEIWHFTNRITYKQNTVKRAKGNLLHPAREDIGVITESRSSLGEFAFAGQYQQRPSPLEGGLVKENWLHCYNYDLPEFYEIIIACDTAAKSGTSNAYSAFVIIGINKNNKKIYLLDVYRVRMEFPELIKKSIEIYNTVKDKYKTLNGTNFLIEDASSGTQLIQYLYDIPQYRGRVKKAGTDSDKITRFAGITPYIENGTVLFPSVAGPWWENFKDELLGFPGTTFKDQCDELAHGIRYAWEKVKSGGASAQLYFNTYKLDFARNIISNGTTTKGGTNA